MVQQIISNAYKKAKRIKINKDSKLIFFSDCHRGDNSYADDFSHNKLIFNHALKDYYEKGYTYFELGDGDELWENHDFEDIFIPYKNIYELLKKYHDKKRLHMIYGNHDMVYRKPKIVEQFLGSYFDVITGKRTELLKDLKFTGS